MEQLRTDDLAEHWDEIAPTRALVCSRCGVFRRRPDQRYCSRCHNAYMREWRKSHPLTGLALVKARARSLAGTALRRGKIERSPCVACGEEDAVMHHPDYRKPLEIVWLCRPCHRQEHAA